MCYIERKAILYIRQSLAYQVITTPKAKSCNTLADILRAQGDRFLDRHQRSFDFLPSPAKLDLPPWKQSRWIWSSHRTEASS